ncbi:MAG TPA: aspartyl/asparaginyl beta-hydroxylase domain-containing protein [Steroidobacteraceae bacterium]|nr:aspartyl/asparaginyl beta-hydroxylase domain-containing protein [Steroidobacteraceae bacterium]
MQRGTRPLGPVECATLRSQTLALSEAIWQEDELRQARFNNVHSQTQSVILIFCDGWPDVRISYHRGWTYLGAAAASVMTSIVAAHYPRGGKVLRAMMARLPAGARIGRHRDLHPSFAASHRIHVPLLTNPDVLFVVGDERVPLQEGVAFELNNALPHEVLNNGESARIHFIFDYAPALDGS